MKRILFLLFFISTALYLAAYLIPNGKTQAAYSALDVNGVLKPYVTR